MYCSPEQTKDNMLQTQTASERTINTRTICLLQEVLNLFLKLNLNKYSFSYLQVIRMHLGIWASVAYLYIKKENHSCASCN